VSDMRAWLIIAGAVTKDDAEFYRTIRVQNGDLIIAVDGGYDNALMFGMYPGVVVGDLDSINSSISKGIKVLQYPAEKDKTDTELAVDYALEQGASEIVILGNIAGRISHSLANIMLLRRIQGAGFGVQAEGLLLSSRERICLLEGGKTSIPKGDSKYLSLIPISDCENVTITNTKYEIKNANIALGSTHLISNEFTILDAKISVEKGEVLIVAEKA